MGDRSLDVTLVSETEGARAHAGSLAVRTAGEGSLADVTERVGAIVRSAGVRVGIALISVPHTTCALVVNEDEPGFREDFRRALERLAPRDADYAHDLAPHDGEEETPNGHAHIRAALLATHSVLLPVRDGALSLGRWQRIFLAELDQARSREIQVTVVGA